MEVVPVTLSMNRSRVANCIRAVAIMAASVISVAF
jgi:hypothetical protein